MATMHETVDQILDEAHGSPLRIPLDREFADNETEFLPAFDCEDRANGLIHVYEELAEVSDVTLRVLWAKAGGKQGGKVRLGKCVKTAGTTRHYAKVEYLIILSADHCREFMMDDRQLEALLYHELRHILIDEDKSGAQTLKIRPHDAELFLDEIRRYGLWTAELKDVREVATQAALPGIDVLTYGGAA